MAVVIDLDNNQLCITDIGVTLRTLLACAATGYATTKKRRFGIKYKEVIIGNISVKTDLELVRKQT